MLQKTPTPSTEWWLDSSGLADRLLWARVERHGDGCVIMLDCDGNTDRSNYDSEGAGELDRSPVPVFNAKPITPRPPHHTPDNAPASRAGHNRNSRSG